MKIPVSGPGGIGSGEDAAEFPIAGASAVEVGTATFWGPRSPVRIARELATFPRRENIAPAADLIGTLKCLEPHACGFSNPGGRRAG